MEDVCYIDHWVQRVVIGVPRGNTILSRLRRAWFCHCHRDDLKMFMLGLLAFDSSIAEEVKFKYGLWLRQVDGTRLLARIAEETDSRRDSRGVQFPLVTSIIGPNGEYRRLMWCCLHGRNSDDPHVL